MSAVNGSSAETSECDVVVVGAGLSGISALYRLRKLGLKTKVFESGKDFGGVWFWNRYPGARVDSEAPFYQLNIPEVYRSWNWSCRFPDHTEIRKYVEHVDATLQLRKDVLFEAHVNAAQYDVKQGKWTIKTTAGNVTTCKYLVLATGLLHRRHYPEFPGLSDYKGVVHHSGFWPENVSVKGKKVAVIGAGATSVQIVQELAKEADQLTMFMRRPSYCLPMQQRPLSKEEQSGWKSYLPKLFEAGRHSLAGFPSAGPDKGVFDASEEEREAHFEAMWERGGFNYPTCSYNDVLLDTKANKVVYDFWAKKIRARISDPVKRDLMAPSEPPYWFGTKRTPLEQDYYECLDQKNVEIVNLSATPLKSFDATGMLTEDGQSRTFDMVVLATGFDSFTGSVTNMGLLNKDGLDMRDVWKDGVGTYLGMLCHGFPNCFMVYSPQAPTALSNGPTIIESQVDFVVDTIAKLEAEHAKSIEPTQRAQNDWATMITTMSDYTLLPLTNSWWTGTNVPGKKAQALTYVGGIEMYEKTCRETMSGWKGFEVIAA